MILNTYELIIAVGGPALGMYILGGRGKNYYTKSLRCYIFFSLEIFEQEDILKIASRYKLLHTRLGYVLDKMICCAYTAEFVLHTYSSSCGKICV